MKIVKKPYLLKNYVQNYEWGTKNEDAFIPKFLGLEAEKDLPYAELWVGTHPKATSSIIIEEKEYPLNEVIAKYPKEVLGKFVADKYDNSLPFLFKVLSANEALSIQAHPDKKLAEILHKKDPKNYPDDNHKPEIAIAIDSLTAIAGFRSYEEILKIVEDFPILKEFISDEVSQKFINRDQDDAELIKMYYSDLMGIDESNLKILIETILNMILKKEDKSQAEVEFATQFKKYGYDVGLLSILMFNIYNLSSDEAFYTGAGIPHCYIKGNILECMANSDNVVRAGLTPKYKDIETLISLIDCETKPDPIIPKEINYTYKTEAAEFEVTKHEGNNIVDENNKVTIIVVLEGNITIKYFNDSKEYNSGDILLIPACLENYEILAAKKNKYFSVTVPNC